MRQDLGVYLDNELTIEQHIIRADNTTDVLLYRQLIVEVDAKILYDFHRLDDVITDWKRQVSRQQLA